MSAESLYDDVVFAGARVSRGHIDFAALRFCSRPYVEMFSGEPSPEWTPPSDAQLRAHLLERWSEEEVDDYFTRREEKHRKRERQLAWEATWRGKVVMGWRAVRREAEWRIPTAWRVLRHGEVESSNDE